MIKVTVTMLGGQILPSLCVPRRGVPQKHPSTSDLEETQRPPCLLCCAQRLAGHPSPRGSLDSIPTNLT